MLRFVGNDLVDLSSQEHIGKSEDRRYVERTLDPTEMEALRCHNTSEARDRFFWASWAAKEAAYKVVKKLDPEIFFSPSKFIVNHEKGLVTFREYVLPVHWEFNERWIHCICTNEASLNSQLEWKLADKEEIEYHSDEFLPHEKVSIHSDESAQVRQLTKNLLKVQGISHYQVVRRPLGTKLAPPELWYEGKCVEKWDISMSHDGNFLAACLLKRED